MAFKLHDRIKALRWEDIPDVGYDDVVADSLSRGRLGFPVEFFGVAAGPGPDVEMRLLRAAKAHALLRDLAIIGRYVERGPDLVHAWFWTTTRFVVLKGGRDGD